MSPESRTRVQERVAEAMKTMPLAQIRKAREMTQVALAEKLKIEQGAVSKIESRSNLYLSSLREYIEGMGGNLELRADFPEESINIAIGKDA
jgi:transcriptional regulator with XRE-family HTH domain